MRQVGTAELKAHLSEHLHAVREGEVVIVMDRKEPIARIVPFGASESGLVIRPATRRLQDIPMPPPCTLVSDPVALLVEDRADRVP